MATNFAAGKISLLAGFLIACLLYTSTRLRGLRCHVNLIPLNAVRERDLHPPTRADVQNFLRRLEARHISATVRREMGADIEGACGQLRRRVLEDRKER